MKNKAMKPAAAEAASRARRLGVLTWMGLVVVAVGWALLVLSIVFADLLIAKAPRLMPPVLHADLIEISRCVIVTGFGLAVLGALQAGFARLDRTFGFMQARSTMADEPRLEPAFAASAPSAPERVAPGQGKRRPYRIFADGSVEVDTIVGTRLFKTMAEAREFI